MHFSKGLEESKALYHSYENEGRPLVGVFNIETKEISLVPCFFEKVWLVEDEQGNFIKGWKLFGLMRIQELSQADTLKFNKLKFAPRFLSSQAAEDQYLSTHEYLLSLLNEIDHVEKYRGFTVTPGKKLTFNWVSGALNSPRNDQGEIIKRVRGSEMLSDDRKQVEEMIMPWNTYPQSREKENLLWTWGATLFGYFYKEKSESISAKQITENKQDHHRQDR